MRKLLICAAFAAGSLSPVDPVYAHGGTYNGPTDFVPPGGGGGGGAGGAPAAGGPSAPGPSGPNTPGASSPGSTPGVPGNPGSTFSPGGADGGSDRTLWQNWWGFNKSPYLNLRSAIHSARVLTNSDEYYLGQGQKGMVRDSLAPSESDIRARIVPALKKALRSERQNDILDASLIALAKIGDAETESGSEPMADDIKKFLSHSSQQLSETAAVSLGILANDSADNVGILLGLLRNDGPGLKEYEVRLTGAVPVRTRAFAAYGLGLIGARAGGETRAEINRALVALLEGEGKHMGTRDVQVASVISMGLTPLALDPIAGALELENPEEGTGWPRPEAVQDRQTQIAFLMNYFEDVEANNFLICAHVPMAVARLLQDLPDEHPLRTAAATRFLRETGRHSKAAREIQQSCVQALGVIGDCDEDPIDAQIRLALMNVGEELADAQARLFALIALGQACGRPGTGAGDPIGGLAVQKDNPRAYLMKKLSKDRSGVRPWAALGLAILERSLDDAKRGSSAGSRYALRESLREAKNPDEVGGFAIAVGITGDPEAEEILLAKLERVSGDEARGYCAIGLGLLDDRTAIGPIQAILAKSKYKPDLLKSAAIGLGLLGDKSIVGTLVGMLEEAAGLSSQAALASALGFIGDQSSVDPLIRMLEDDQKTALARGFAAAALGIVADKEALPWNSKVSVNLNYRANTRTLTSPDTGTGLLDLL